MRGGRRWGWQGCEWALVGNRGEAAGGEAAGTRVGNRRGDSGWRRKGRRGPLVEKERKGRAVAAEEGVR
jgi:hypothetical protein